MTRFRMPALKTSHFLVLCRGSFLQQPTCSHDTWMDLPRITLPWGTSKGCWWHLVAASRLVGLNQPKALRARLLLGLFASQVIKKKSKPEIQSITAEREKRFSRKPSCIGQTFSVTLILRRSSAAARESHAASCVTKRTRADGSRTRAAEICGKEEALGGRGEERT